MRCTKGHSVAKRFQDLATFTMPGGFRGRSAVYVQIWWLVQSCLFKASPQICYGFRRWLLRRFGAKIGKGVLIRPTVEITYPWRLEIGDHSWIGDDVVLYSLGTIRIGSHAVVSQRSYICAADHNMKTTAFEIRAYPVTIEDEVWIATDVFVAPNVNVGRGTVVGARSSVFRDLPPGMVCCGSPCKPVATRST